MLRPWLSPSVSWCRPAIALAWRRSSPIGTARRSTSPAPGWCCSRPTGSTSRPMARRAGISRPAVWRWQRRYAEAGVDGLLRDKTRKPGKAPPGRRPGAPGGGADLRRAARRGDPLDRPRHGRGRRGLAALGAADLGRPQAPAAPGAHLQALARSRLPRQAGGDRRPLHGPAAARGGPLRRREEPDPGPRPHPARAADQARQVRDHDPRLQAERHDDAVRRARTCSTARCSAAACSGTATRSSSAS